MADIPVKIYKSRKIREGTRPSNPDFPESDPPPVINPPGSGPSYLSLIDTKDSNYNGKNGFVPIVVNENELQLVPLPQLQENGLISGGIVQWTGSGYVFNGSGAFYRIGGSPYSSPATQLTLSAPDPTDDRIDVFAVDINGDMVVIEGTPAATPVKPQIDPATQLELTSVIVTAASTEPTLTEEILYDDAAIWTGTSGGSGTVNFTSTADPCEGTNSIEVTNAQNGTYIQFDNGSELDISPFQTFGFLLKLKSNMPNGQTIALGLYDGSMNAVISPIPLAFDKTSLDCQFVGIVLSGQPFVSLNVRYVRFQFIRFSGATTYLGFFLDMVKFEGGINPPVTVGLTGSGTANEIAYFTGPTALASLAVATYPSLTELAYVKGVTSAIQSQLNGKQATIAGTLTDTYVATVVAGVATWAAPSGGSSNWTVVGSDIYRNSSVAIGRTTIPTNATFAVQSKSATALHEFFTIQLNNGTSIFNIVQDGSSGRVMSVTPYFMVGNPSTNTLNNGVTIKSVGATGGVNAFRILDSANAIRFQISDNGCVLINQPSGYTFGQGLHVKGRVSNATPIFTLDNAANTRLFEVRGDGDQLWLDGGDLILGTTTGTKIGTATSQKLAFWNKTPIIQPTTGITGATLVGGGGTTITATDTFGGYTLQQIAAALINTGLLA